jgi:PhnB protein
MNTGRLPPGASAITPFLCVNDVDAAVAFYVDAFGFTRELEMQGRDGRTVHAELAHGGQKLMIGAENVACGSVAPTPAAAAPFGLYLYVEDVDALLARASAKGATVRRPCADMSWGDRMGSLVDPFGHHWTFATFLKETAATETARGDRP